jgi:pyruvoyl-dependent arginine decarboxylase (PvlArgDC)
MFRYFKESWCGDSRDGKELSSEGHHFFRIDKSGLIVEAYEYYETDEGESVATPLPEMVRVHWIKDLGFEDFETLDEIKEMEFNEVKTLAASQ